MMHNEGNDFQLLCECVKISCTNNMGNLMTACGRKMKEQHVGLPLIEGKHSEIIQTIWKTVEKDSAYYGFAMYTTLFKNYPQYAKYFEDEAIPEFVREAKVKKKFTIIYDIIAVLFINYNVKPAQRDYLLGYIAIQHKDMGLTIQDIENFISCIVEALCTELPQLMTSENVIVQMKYFNIVSESMILLMEKYNTKIDEMSRAASKDDKHRRKPMGMRRASRRQRSASAKERFSSDSDPNAEHNRPGKRKHVPSIWQLPNVLKEQLHGANTAPEQLPMKTIHEEPHDKTLKDSNRVEKNDSPIEIQKNHEATLAMPANPQSLKETTASVNRNDAARKRKRQRNNSVSQAGGTSYMT